MTNYSTKQDSQSETDTRVNRERRGRAYSGKMITPLIPVVGKYMMVFMIKNNTGM